MKRKHLFFIIYTVTLCGLLSCENEIPYNPETRQPCLVMNALLEAGESKTNEVYLYLSTGDNLDKVNDDAILTLYVNGRLTETPQAFKPEDIYPYPGEWLSPEDYETLLKKHTLQKISPINSPATRRPRPSGSNSPRRYPSGYGRSTSSPASPGFPCGHLYRPAQHGQRHRHSPPSLPRDNE